MLLGQGRAHIVARLCFPANHEIILVFHDAAQALAHDRVVIDDQHAPHGRSRPIAAECSRIEQISPIAGLLRVVRKRVVLAHGSVPRATIAESAATSACGFPSDPRAWPRSKRPAAADSSD